MERRASAILRYLVAPRSILLALAIFNFTITWEVDAEMHFRFAAYPSYHPWSYLNEPTILIVSSLFLNANRWWANTVALLVSGYLIGSFVHILLMFDNPVIYDWKLIRMYCPYLVDSWDRQYLFALVVFCYSALSLKKNFLCRRITIPAE